ncbi:MAG: hypothetical protein R3D71_01035 [Rickettsiales bacterium]
MVINVNPSLVNIQSGSSGRRDRNRSLVSSKKYVIPNKAEINNIPAPETMNTMIRSAVDALRGGVFWDRGTMLNLLV